jgi:class 3 adenylate cyclase
MAAETITVLFTDLVGSTELLSRVGDVIADELRREHFTLLRQALTEHDGREIKNLGDGLMVVFDGTAAAVGAAVAMQQAMAARPSSAEPLAVKIGISAGDAEAEEGDYFGVPVVEAARLCARAGGGEILTTVMVRLLARSRSAAEFELVGDLELKGLEEPVETWRVPWAPAPESGSVDRPPLPARITTTAGGAFVGRREEQERLAAVWKVVDAGECRVMLLGGEPGMGKTTLASRFAATVYDNGATVVYGRCDEDLGIPYQPWIELLRQLVVAAPDEMLAAHAAERGAHLARLVPELSRRTGVEPPQTADNDSERFVLFGCITDLLSRWTVEAPLLLVLDDLHWADRSTLQLLRHVANADGLRRVGMLGTYRDSEITAGHPLTDLLAALHREGGGDRIVMRGLDDRDVLELLEQIAGHEMDDAGVALRDAILTETAGNPFFTVEILRHLSEAGAIYQREDGRWVSDLDLRAAGLPISVREVIGRRIATLGDDTARLLALGSVIGRDFDVALLAAVAETSEDDVIDVCDDAVTAAILATTDDPDRYSFAHALIEHTLYDGLSPARRARAHRAVAQALEQARDADLRAGELAYHWSQAVQQTDLTKALHYAKLAGARALDQMAPDDAIGWYVQALELLDRNDAPEPRERVEILIGLGEAQRQSGVADYRDNLLEASRLADALDEVDLLVTAVLANNRGMMSETHHADVERIALIDRALERIDPARAIDRARLLALACLERIYAGSFEERFALAEQAIAAARAADDPDVLVSTMIFCADGIFGPVTRELRRSWVAEAGPLAGSLTNPTTRYLVQNWTRYTVPEWADAEAVREADRRANEAIAKVPQAAMRWNNAFHQVWQETVWGDLAEAERLLDASLGLGLENGEPDAMTMYGAQLMNIRDFQGRLDELVPLVEDAILDAPTMGYQSLLAKALAYHGREPEALVLLDGDFAGVLDSMMYGYNWATMVSLWAEAAARVGHGPAAELLHEQLAPFSDHIVSSSALMRLSVAHYLGLLDHSLGRLDDADARFREAMALHERFGSQLFVVHTKAAWAALLADRNRGDDRDRAIAMAEAALTAAIAGGYGYVESDARTVLERLR